MSFCLPELTFIICLNFSKCKTRVTTDYRFRYTAKHAVNNCFHVRFRFHISTKCVRWFRIIFYGRFCSVFPIASIFNFLGPILLILKFKSFKIYTNQIYCLYHVPCLFRRFLGANLFWRNSSLRNFWLCASRSLARSLRSIFCPCASRASALSIGLPIFFLPGLSNVLPTFFI